jgi:hypothetical protein
VDQGVALREEQLALAVGLGGRGGLGRRQRLPERECMCERKDTHSALLNATTIESDPHHSIRRSGLVRGDFALVIFVAASTRSSRNSYKKLTTNRTTRRLVVWNRSNAAPHASALFANVIQSLYISEGMTRSGSTNSRSQSRYVKAIHSPQCV